MLQISSLYMQFQPVLAKLSCHRHESGQHKVKVHASKHLTGMHLDSTLKRVMQVTEAHRADLLCDAVGRGARGSMQYVLSDAELPQLSSDCAIHQQPELRIQIIQSLQQSAKLAASNTADVGSKL